MKKVISLTLSVLLILSICIFNVAAVDNSDFHYIEDDGEAIITGYTGNDTDIVIPNIINGLVVEGIGDKAFYQNHGLKSVTLTNGIEEIGDMAFYNCTGLTKVVIPDSVEEIGDSAFSYCVYLTDVSIGSGIDEISNNCFSHDTRLESIVIPHGVVEIDDGAFEECTHLTDVKLPSTLKEIGKYAFAYTYNLANITFPSSLQVINEGAFYFNSALTSVSVPASVTSLGHYAFYSNTSLAEVDLNEGLITIGDLAFDTTALKSLYVPSTVLTVGSHPFGFIYNEETFEYEINPDFTALCVGGSYAQQFCAGFGINYTTVSVKENTPDTTAPQVTTTAAKVIKGDVNFDGRINEIDLTLIHNHLAYLNKLAENELDPADFDSSGIVNVKDITQIQVAIK